MASRRARELRRNMTDAERKLWWILRRKQLEGFPLPQAGSAWSLLRRFFLRESAARRRA
jgi:hypothetical protein